MQTTSSVRHFAVKFSPNCPATKSVLLGRSSQWRYELNLVGEDSALLTAMTSEVALTVAVRMQLERWQKRRRRCSRLPRSGPTTFGWGAFTEARPTLWYF
jgi:hypothetical protein